MFNKLIKYTNMSLLNCNHCKNLCLSNNHYVKCCPVLEQTLCFNCKNKGHTFSYCPEKTKPVVCTWATIAKKGMTLKDEEMSAIYYKTQEEKHKKETQTQRTICFFIWLLYFETPYFQTFPESPKRQKRY